MVKREDIITTPVSDSMKNEAKKTADLKAKNTQDTWLSKRTLEERYSTLFMGDLAKIGLKTWLRNNSKQVVDYDEVRTNNYKNKDKYDLRVKEKQSNQWLEVEIKSSLEKEGNYILEQTLQTRNLMTYPGREKDINIQAYFLPSTGGLNNIHLIAWADKGYLQRLPKWIMRAQSEREQKRTQYDSILCNLFPMRKLLERII